MAKGMKPAELRQMSPEQLELTLKDTIKHLFQLRFRTTTERMEASGEMTKARRDIARIRTIQRERELAATRGKT